MSISVSIQIRLRPTQGGDLAFQGVPAAALRRCPWLGARIRRAPGGSFTAARTDADGRIQVRTWADCRALLEWARQELRTMRFRVPITVMD